MGKFRPVHGAYFLVLARAFWIDPTRRLKDVEGVLGVTKNALIGLAHRNKWLRGGGQTVAPFAATALTAVHGGCMWPYGDPKGPNFRFCGGAVHHNRSYCRTRCEVAYIGFKPDEDENAA